MSTYKLDSIFNSVPDKHDLLEMLVDIKHLWYNIGIALRVPHTELMSLLHSATPDLLRLSSVLQCWIDKRTTEVTWNSIITATKSKIVGQTTISDEIRRHVLSSSQQYDNSHIKPDNLLSSERLLTEKCNDEQRKQGKLFFNDQSLFVIYY